MHAVGELDPLTSDEDTADAITTISRERWVVALIVLASYQALACILCWPLVSHLFTQHVITPDATLDSWGFAWLPFAVTHLHNPFFTVYVGWPTGVNVLSNTTQLGLAFLEWPITALFGPDTSFNLAVVTAPTLGAGSAYLLARRVTTNRVIAWVSGILYGFGAYELTALASNHLQLLIIAIPPLLLVAVLEALTEQRVEPRLLGAGVAVLVIFEFFVSTEVLVVSAFMIGLAAIALGVAQRRSLAGRWRSPLLSLLYAGAMSTIVLAFPGLYAIAGPGHVHGPEILTPQAYRADLLGPLMPTSSFLIAPSHVATIASHFATASSENYSYLGVPLVLLALGTIVVFRRRPVIVMAAVLLGASFILSLGGGLAIAGSPAFGPSGTTAIGTWLPGRLLENAPVLASIIPSRLALFSSLAMVLLFAAALDRILARLAPRGALLSRATVIAIAGLCLLPGVPRLPLLTEKMAPNGIPRGITSLVTSTIPHDAAIITYPYPSGIDLEPLRWQESMGFPFRMPAGYFRVPQGPHDNVAFDPAVGYAFVSLPARVLIGLQAGTPEPLTPTLIHDFRATLLGWNVHWLVGRTAGTGARSEFAYLAKLTGSPARMSGSAFEFRISS